MNSFVVPKDKTKAIGIALEVIRKGHDFKSWLEKDCPEEILKDSFFREKVRRILAAILGDADEKNMFSWIELCFEKLGSSSNDLQQVLLTCCDRRAPLSKEFGKNQGWDKISSLVKGTAFGLTGCAEKVTSLRGAEKVTSLRGAWALWFAKNNNLDWDHEFCLKMVQKLFAGEKEIPNAVQTRFSNSERYSLTNMDIALMLYFQVSVEKWKDTTIFYDCIFKNTYSGHLEKAWEGQLLFEKLFPFNPSSSPKGQNSYTKQNLITNALIFHPELLKSFFERKPDASSWVTKDLLLEYVSNSTKRKVETQNALDLLLGFLHDEEFAKDVSFFYSLPFVHRSFGGSHFQNGARGKRENLFDNLRLPLPPDFFTPLEFYSSLRLSPLASLFRQVKAFQKRESSFTNLGFPSAAAREVNFFFNKTLQGLVLYEQYVELFQFHQQKQKWMLLHQRSFSRRVVDAQFSPNGKYIICEFREPHWIVILDCEHFQPLCKLSVPEQKTMFRISVNQENCLVWGDHKFPCPLRLISPLSVSILSSFLNCFPKASSHLIPSILRTLQSQNDRLK